MVVVAVVVVLVAVAEAVVVVFGAQWPDGYFIRALDKMATL